MKKVLLVLLVMFVSLMTVHASTSSSSTIKLEGVNITADSTVAYNGTLDVKYDLNPVDADNKNVTWSVSNLVEGVTATFVDGNTTNASTGNLKISFSNATSDVQKVTLTAKDSTNNELKSIEVSVQTKDATTNLENKAKEIENLISKLPEEITSNNYDDVNKKLNDIEKILNANVGVEDFVSKDSITKYDDMVNKFASYKNKSITMGTIVTMVILGLSFIFGLFIIFKKEEK